MITNYLLAIIFITSSGSAAPDAVVGYYTGPDYRGQDHILEFRDEADCKKFRQEVVQAKLEKLREDMPKETTVIVECVPVNSVYY